MVRPTKAHISAVFVGDERTSVGDLLRYALAVFDRGSLILWRWRGVPLKIHWTLPVGAALLMGLRPGAWLGFFILILAHELGHAALVRMHGLRLESVEVHGIGGVCRYSGRTSPRARSVIAWGGVLAQGLLLAGAYGWLALRGHPQSHVGGQLLDTLMGFNLLIIGLNLLPLPMLDGWQAWQLPLRLFQGSPPATLVRAPEPPPIPRNAQMRPPLPRSRSTAQPFASQPGAGAGTTRSPSGQFPAAVVFETEDRLPAETEAYLRAILERARKKAQPKN